MSIVCEGHDELGQGKRGAIGGDAGDTWTFFQNLNEVVEKGEEHGLGKASTWSDSIIVAQVLAVLVLLELVIGEYAAPCGESPGDLRLKTAEIGKYGYIVRRERQVPAKKCIETVSDRWEVNAVPDRDIVSTVGVFKVWAGVGGCQAIAN